VRSHLDVAREPKVPDFHRAFIARSLPFVIVRCCPQTGSDLP
jgi:hypothetical protein